MEKHIKTLNEILLTEFLDAVLGPTLDRHPISSNIAAQISIVDKEEQFCHVEFPSIHNVYERPHVWRIDDWKKSYRRETQRRQINHLERAVWVLQTELIVKLKQAIARKLSSNDENACEITAKVVVKTRSITSAVFFGVNISELIDADKALSNYRLNIISANDYTTKTI